MFSGSAVILSLTIFAKSSSSFKSSVTDSSRNKFPCILKMQSQYSSSTEDFPERMLIFCLLARVSGGAGHSITVDNWLLPHVEPDSLGCLFSRTLGHFFQNFSETFGCGLSTAENWEPSNLQIYMLYKLNIETEKSFEMVSQTCLKFGAPSKLFSSPSICIPSK